MTREHGVSSGCRRVLLTGFAVLDDFIDDPSAKRAFEERSDKTPLGKP